MKKKYFKLYFIIPTIIIIGFLCVISSFYFSFRRLFRQDLISVSEVCSQNIYSQINNLIDIPLNVSITMANDVFLRDFTQEQNTSSNFDVERMKEYLSKYQKKYDFDSVFFVSTKTNEYYHFANGLDRVLTKENPENVWYYDFLQSSDEYQLNIDNDEANDNYITMFVNCKIHNQNNEVVGIVGVGLKTPYMQQFISNAENSYDVNTYLIDPTGLVMLSSNYTKFDNVNIFSNTIFSDMANAINTDINNSENALWYHTPKIDGYVITKYIPNLNWYLIVEKNSHTFSTTMEIQLFNTIFLALLVIFIVDVLITLMVSKHNKEVLLLSQKDHLTNVGNREAYSKDIQNKLTNIATFNSLAIGVVDLNFLKYINDTYGHQIGDNVIQALCKVLCTSFENFSVYRIGGDEFTIIFTDTDAQHINEMWKKATQLFEIESNNYPFSLSFAFGFAFWNCDTLNNAEKIFKSADDCMYKNKKEIKSKSKNNNLNLR